MKKVIAWLLVLALTAAVSIGATLAYLTDTDEDVNVMTLGEVKIDQLEYERVDVESKDDKAEVQEFHDNKPLLPAVTDKNFDYTPGTSYVDWEQIGKDEYTSEIWNPENINNEVDKMVFVKNKGDYDAFVRSVFAFEAGNYKTLDEFKKMVHLNLNETDYEWEWLPTPVTIGQSTYFVATATYNKVLAPGALTEISLSQIALDSSATNADVEAFGDTYQVLVKSQGIQADGFDDAADALDEGFGVITTTNVPWDNDTPTKGIDVRTALHYLDGDSTTDAITANVSSVTFGLNKNYAAIADANNGVLVDVEQDVPVYAYYVKNGSNYDVYFLADDDIYLPKDSTALMKDMTALTVVNTENLNTSRTENMKQLFRKCSKLTTLDTTKWDTSKVTSTHQVFYQCSALQTIPGIESWDTGASTTMRGMFAQCGVKGDLDLTSWDVSNVTDMYMMFYKCPNLVNLDTDGWDTGACTNMGYMFNYSSNLKTVKAAGWDTSEVTNMYAMFGMCGKLVSLDATGWTNSKVADTSFMFIDDVALTTLTGSGGWNFASAIRMEEMFKNCDRLTVVDVTNWDMSKAEQVWNLFNSCDNLVGLTGEENWKLSSAINANFMFQFCGKLKELNVTNWGMNNVITMSFMFQYCSELEFLDPSQWQTGNCQEFNSMFSYCQKLQFDKDAFDNWDMSNATRINHMFYDCRSIQELNLSGWNMPNLITTTHMFADCFSLKTVNFDDWNTPSLVSLDCIFNDCGNLTYLDMSDVDTANVTEFSQMFERCTSLKRVDGMENWNTAKSGTFAEMFLDCSSLEELNWSSFDTKAAYNNYYDTNNSYSKAFNPIFRGVNNLTKLIVSDKISYYGNGTVPEADKLVFPDPKPKEGYTAMWRNVETGELYLGKDIPEFTAATYEAYYEPIVTNP